MLGVTDKLSFLTDLILINNQPVLFHLIWWGECHSVSALSTTMGTLALGGDCHAACKFPDASDSGH